MPSPDSKTRVRAELVDLIEKSKAASNPHTYRELCLPFPWQVFLGNQSRAFVRLSRLAFDYWLVTQTKNSKLL